MNIGILPSVNSSRQKRDVKPGMSVCSRIMRLMNNQTKKAPKGYYSPKRRESDNKNAVAIERIVSQLGCVSQDTDALDSQGTKEPRGNLMQSLGINKKSTVHPVYSTSIKYPGKQRTIAWNNTIQTSKSAKSPRYEI